MALSFLKVRADFDQITEALTEEEKGRLLLAMVRYAQDGEEPQLTGAERILWPVFRADINRDRVICQALAENGKKGGRPRKSENQTEPEETNENQTKPNETKENQTKPKNNLVFEEKEAEREREQEKRTKREKEIEKGQEKERENAPAREELEGPDDFGRFWILYPRKEGKKAARKAWDRIRPDQEQQAQIISALQVQKASDQWTRDSGKFIPHPATWLNGERWKDETIIPARASPVRQVPAQLYEQRDYDGEQEEAMRRMIAGMAVPP